MASDISWKVESNRMTGEIQGQIRNVTYEAVRRTCDRVLADVIRRMHIPGTGRIYTRGGLTHQASAPGQAPAADAGDLIASYEIFVTLTPTGPAGIVGSTSPYAARLEYGGGNIAPRPALTPAMQAEAPNMVSAFESMLQAASS